MHSTNSQRKRHIHRDANTPPQSSRSILKRVTSQFKFPCDQHSQKYTPRMPSGAAPVDHFPPTQRLWIVDHLAEIGEDAMTPAALQSHRELCRFIMERYHSPLCAYASAAGLRDLGEPADLVAGFFAKELSTPAMLQRWRLTNVSLRRWLMTAMSLHCRGLRRDRRREHHRVVSDQFAAPQCASDPTPERAFDLVWACGVIRAAAEHAAAQLVTEGIAVDWKLFERHIVDGVPYAQAALELGIPHKHARAINRLAASRFRSALERELQREGIAAVNMPRAMDDLKKTLSVS